MDKGTFVFDKQTQKMVPADEFYAKKNRGVKRSSLPSPMVMGDIKPFLNVAIDGREISSRSHKREMMRQHSLVEAGDMKPQATRKLHKPKGIRASMKRSLQQLGA